MIEIEQKWIDRFYFDPVMAAHVIMGARLDTFQKARLRFFWFTPETIDSSGVGTGKTIVDFAYLNLRCILIPNQIVPGVPLTAGTRRAEQAQTVSAHFISENQTIPPMYSRGRVSNEAEPRTWD